jgi:hypothetical protein
MKPILYIPISDVVIFFSGFFFLVWKFGVQDSISAFFYRLLEIGHSYLMYVFISALVLPILILTLIHPLPVGTLIAFILASVGLLFGVAIAGNYKDKEMKTDLIHYVGSVMGIGGYLVGLWIAGLWWPAIVFTLLTLSVSFVKFEDRTTWIEVYGFVCIVTGIGFMLW